jgi:hypothetical protein
MIDQIYTATHRCKTCFALWRLNPPDPNAAPGSPLREETWSVVTPERMRACCDQGDMGEAVEPLGPCPHCEIQWPGCDCPVAEGFDPARCKCGYSPCRPEAHAGWRGSF